MAFTYVGSLVTDLDKARFFLGDTVANSGPRPDKRNFTDAEIDAVVALAGSLPKGIALCFGTLASEWTSYNLSEREGEVDFDAKGLSDKYLALAKEWQSKDDVSSGAGTISAGVITLDFMQKDEAA